MRTFWFRSWTEAGRLSSGLWLLGVLLTLPPEGRAQPAPAAAPREDTLALRPGQTELYLDENYYSVLEDPGNRLTLSEVRSTTGAGRFRPMRGSGQPPNIQHPASTYWLRLTVRHPAALGASWFLELYDPHIGEAVFYRPQPGARAGVFDDSLSDKQLPGKLLFDSLTTGASRPFATRPHPYKNFLFDLPPQPPGRTATYYLRLRSDSRTSFRAMLHDGAGLIPEVALQYWLLGTFYGVLVIMGLYNLILFFFLNDRSHLAYALYVLSGMLLFLSEDGLGFQYLWPGLPGLNHLVSDAAPVLLLLTFATYASGFLDAASRVPALHRAGRWVVGLSAGLLVLDVAVVHSGFSFWLYLLPYGLFYYTALRAYRTGLRPARYLLLAQALVAGSLVFLILRKLGIDFYYSTLLKM